MLTELNIILSDITVISLAYTVYIFKKRLNILEARVALVDYHVARAYADTFLNNAVTQIKEKMEDITTKYQGIGEQELH